MAQISGALVLTVASLTLIYVLRAISRERKRMEEVQEAKVVSPGA
jgi:hypothetical protein